MKRWIAAAAVLAVLVGVMAFRHGICRQLTIHGTLPLPVVSEETPPLGVEIWFPDQRILFDARGRQWIRDRCGRLHPRTDPGARFTKEVRANGEVRLRLTLTTWLPPRRCTVAFVQNGYVTRYARNLACQGWGNSLTAQLPKMSEPLSLNNEEP